eukprot:TRINITY_DN16668_c0_g2_i1.p1 TRINITY_DN16668_c0_g2~~TRINITY_DN16668_c0_g2_i1.p1  ORF type:complete len:860 (+),score=95.04 TRINITY_DN16668_c0_g2_i1:81-2660(+)
MKRKHDEVDAAGWVGVVRSSAAFANIAAGSRSQQLVQGIVNAACEGEVLAAVRALWGDVAVLEPAPRLAAVGLCDPPAARVPRAWGALASPARAKYRRLLVKKQAAAAHPEVDVVHASQTTRGAGSRKPPARRFAEYAAAAAVKSTAGALWEALDALQQRSRKQAPALYVAELQAVLWDASRSTHDPQGAPQLGIVSAVTGGAIDGRPMGAQSEPAAHLAGVAAVFAFAGGCPLIAHVVLECGGALRPRTLLEDPHAFRFALATTQGALRVVLSKARGCPLPDQLTGCASGSVIQGVYDEVCALVECLRRQVSKGDDEPAAVALWCEVLYGVGYVLTALDAADRLALLRRAERAIVEAYGDQLPVGASHTHPAPDMLPTPLPKDEVASQHSQPLVAREAFPWAEEVMWDGDAVVEGDGDAGRRSLGAAYVVALLYAAAPQWLVRHTTLPVEDLWVWVVERGCFEHSAGRAGNVAAAALDRAWAHSQHALCPQTRQSVCEGLLTPALGRWVRFMRWVAVQPHAVVRWWPLLRSHATGLRMTSPDDNGARLALRYLALLRFLLPVLPKERVAEVLKADCLEFLTSVGQRLIAVHNTRAARSTNSTYEVAMRKEEGNAGRQSRVVKESNLLAALIATALATAHRAFLAYSAHPMVTPQELAVLDVTFSSSLGTLRNNADVVAMCRLAGLSEEGAEALLQRGWQDPLAKRVDRDQKALCAVLSTPASAGHDATRRVMVDVAEYATAAVDGPGVPQPSVEAVATALLCCVHSPALTAGCHSFRSTMCLGGEDWPVPTNKSKTVRALAPLFAALLKLSTTHPLAARTVTSVYNHVLATLKGLPSSTHTTASLSFLAYYAPLVQDF